LLTVRGPETDAGSVGQLRTIWGQRWSRVFDSVRRRRMQMRGQASSPWPVSS
jgi:hypothetical protein